MGRCEDDLWVPTTSPLLSGQIVPMALRTQVEAVRDPTSTQQPCSAASIS
jgi:hypothetical protein